MKLHKIRKGLGLVLAASLTAGLLSACGGGTSTGTADATGAATAETAAQEAATQAPPEADTSRKTASGSGERYDKITVALSSDPSDLGPTGYGDTAALYTMHNYYETLFDFRDGEYVPILAKSYTEVDATHWEVELWDNIKDSEGNPITADDVVFSYNLLIDSGKAAKFNSFVSIEAKDDYTLTFTWSKEIDSVGELEWPLCRVNIVSQKAYEDGGNTMASQPVGTGPYVVTEYTPGAKIVMEANDNYWQSDENRDPDHQANVQTVEYDIISEGSQHVIALGTDTVQYSEYVPNESLADFQEGGQYADGHAVFSTQGSGLQCLFPDCSEGFLADENFRKAVFYALNNEAIAQATGTLEPAKAFGTPFFADYDTAWESQEGNYMAVYDVEKAKEYLAQTDYNGESLVLLCPSSDLSKTMAQMVQTLLLQIGINVEINAEEGNLVDTDMRDPANFDLLIKDLGGGSQIGEFNRAMNYEEFGTGLNLAGLHDEEFQTFFLNCSTVDGHTTENMAQLHQMLLDNGYYYAIGSPRMTGVYSDAFATLVYREHEFLRPGACDYYLD
ncbi:MAG: ABC transporter substrate-binding protein [Eubacteriales bacterium]|nr:ABC transporter substrate-binding protein [Eubacteriales bacterium]